MKGGALVVLILYVFTKYQVSEAKCFDRFHLDGGGRGLCIFSALGRHASAISPCVKQTHFQSCPGHQHYAHQHLH